MCWMKTVTPIIGVLLLIISDNYPVNAKIYSNFWEYVEEVQLKPLYKAFPGMIPPESKIKVKPKNWRKTTVPVTVTEKIRDAVKPEMMLFDFTKLETLNGWYELSDVVRQQGMSKAVLALQKTKMFQRAVFFTLLNPQPNGAGFASYRVDVNLNLSSYTKIQMYCRGQGENLGYKINLRHKNQNREPFPSYEQMFQAPMGKFQIVELQLANFEPYFRGQKLNDSEPLDLTAITNFEFQVYGGVYLPIKQSGTSSLEIDWIKALM